MAPELRVKGPTVKVAAELRPLLGARTPPELIVSTPLMIPEPARMPLPLTTTGVSPSVPLTLRVPVVTVVRRWPNSLPQYAVGHLDRVAGLESRLRELLGLTLLGNALHGVGIPDLIRDARAAARQTADSH